MEERRRTVGADQPDAAYNYEFVARLRDTLNKPRPGAAATLPVADPLLTLHGHMGGPPKNVEMSKFKVMIPKQGDERQENQDAGKSSARQRRG